MSLSRTAVTGISSLACSKLALAVVSFVLNIVLARLIEPHDFGLIGMITVFTAVFSVLSSMGMDSAIVGKRELSDVELDTLFWIKVMVGVLFAGVISLLAEPIASFYREPRLVPLTRGVSLIFITSGLYTIQRTLMRKQMRFPEIALYSVLSIVAGGIMAIVAACLGWGVWSLVWQLIAQDIAALLLFWPASRWSPRLRLDLKGSREVLSFGFTMLGSSLALYAQRNVDYLIVGRLLGATPLGYYSLAYRIMYLPVRQISYLFTDVLFPVFATARDQVSQLRKGYGKSLKITSLVTFPAMLLVMLNADDLVKVFFGAKWLPAAALLKILAPSGAVQSIAQIGYLLFPAMARPKLSLRLGAVSCLVVVVTIPIGAYLAGVNGVCAAILTSTILNWIPTQWFAGRLVHYSILDLFRDLTSALVACVAAFAVFWLTSWTGWLAISPAAVRLAVNVALPGIACAATVMALEWPQLQELWFLVRRRRGGGSGKAVAAVEARPAS